MSNLPSSPQLENASSEPRQALHTFPPPTIFPPLRQPHSQTIIFLHGRGSSARIFAPDLLSTSVAGLETDGCPKSLRESLPNTKFVFPTAPRSRATIYRRSIINQWFDGSGDWEETVLGHARETIDFLHELLSKEAWLVGGADKVFLGGFSQGCATALVCMLLWEGDPLGGIVGMCGMLPMGGVLDDALRQGDSGDGRLEYHGVRQESNVDIEDDVFEPSGDDTLDPFSHDERGSPASPLVQALNLLREEVGFPLLSSNSEPRVHESPVFLGHGAEDDNVLLQYAEDASRVFQMAGCSVVFKIYEGLGHYHSPPMLRDILEFLGRERERERERESNSARKGASG
ncbi:acyl-protein thioesterase [Colletotrichum kahawae]|uniref:Acyl-protein thioesterase n=1 Tax=Colletotrichum kahawae TaxID=34407 RepID=A0AAD9YJL9_COLKA|nr:acyl-protein thioesterase [Colletotrichum kahawae]